MSLVYLYFVFALATGLTALYEIMQPVVAIRTAEGFHIENKYIMYFVFLILTIILAPAVFFSCIIPSMGEVFRNALYKGLFLKE